MLYAYAKSRQPEAPGSGGLPPPTLCYIEFRRSWIAATERTGKCGWR